MLILSHVVVTDPSVVCTLVVLNLNTWIDHSDNSKSFLK